MRDQYLLCVEDSSKGSAGERGPGIVEFGQIGNPGKAAGLRLEKLGAWLTVVWSELTDKEPGVRSCGPGMTLVAGSMDDIGI